MQLQDRPAAETVHLAENLDLPWDCCTDTFAILGNRGGGKSATARQFVEELHRVHLPVVVLDVKGDWWGIRSSADGAGPGLPFVIFGGDHGDVSLEPSAGELLANLAVDDHLPMILDLSDMSKTKARSFATAFVEHLYRRSRDPLHVVIEEADVLIPQRATAETARLLGAMEDLAKRGRSRGLGVTICSQRPQEVSKSVLDLMETVVLLRMTGPRSLAAVKEWIGANADVDDAAAQVIPSLPSLQTGEAWVWSPGFLRLLKRVHVTRFATFDSHATPRPGAPRITPKGRADIDLAKLSAEIAATAERTTEHDQRKLQTRLAELRSDLAEARRRNDALAADKDALIAELRQRIHTADDHLTEALKGLNASRDAITAATTLLAGPAGETLNGHTPAATPAEHSPLIDQPSQPATRTHAPSTRPGPDASNGTDRVPTFPAGARRMLESLARMAPLRLTAAQWGMVTGLKHTGGTWSTYLGLLRRAGFLDKADAGYTLSQAGFDHLGQRPEPMTGPELQAHYLNILTAGAARMLQAVIDTYPHGLTRAELADRVGLTYTAGTFSTYLGTLRRNGLVAKNGDQLVASSILIHGAAAQPGDA